MPSYLHLRLRAHFHRHTFRYSLANYRAASRASSRGFTSTALRLHAMAQDQPLSANAPLPRIDRVSPLPADQARWIQFQKIDWTDQTGKPRVWEAAARTTRGASGVDAVAMCALLLGPGQPTRTIIVKQFRPALGAVCVEFPAGLVDGGESVEDAAVRELREETGLKGRVVQMTPVVASDPGMSTANMQFAVLEVEGVGMGEELPKQELEEGEFIERVVVEVDGLYERLKGFAEEGFVVDARLFHWAAGVQFAKVNARRYGLTVAD
ncbi:hypothetical protein EJ06DRAFT_534225 [Trichodelitschia bisporula]|uniref:Nudix hydrolase domain-containing protein n=1 Tax=Trichodelitschia bisporula TaxID=703511 RepID=A0A6G1HJC4_9PEZI|nr:hypothetical protein EJ06DRAFT_534225 [Trichodelitschia bisporula]